MSADLTPDTPVCSQEAARAAGLDVAPSPAELLAVAESIVSSWGDRAADPDDVVASTADTGAQLARAVPLVLAGLDRLRAERERWEANWRAERTLRLEDETKLRARVAELEGAANCSSEITTSLGTSECALPVRHRGDHRNAEKNHYWSDEFATRQTEAGTPTP
ncbi:hypothetical protein [Streptomyces sp. NPDC058092]|uniref:hypothetical protein n=1 Tax=Streptomyces sp. NPDC058092 TaxID=3346336 RepID=UPI0036EE8E43